MKDLLLRVLNILMQGLLRVFGRIDYHIVGSLPDPATLADLQDPYPGINAVRERGTVLRSYTNNGWIVTGYDEVTGLLRDERVTSDFSQNGFIKFIMRLAVGDLKMLNIDTPTMLTLDPPDHTRLRKLVAKGFVHKYIQSLAPTIEHLVDDLLDQIPAEVTQFDVIQTLAKPLPAIVIAEMMGVEANERHLFEQWSDDLLGGTDLGKPEHLRKAARAHLQMRGYLADLTQAKRAEPGQDLISQLIEAEEEGDKLTLDELYSNCILLLAAGHETTTRLIGNCLLLLLQHPDQMRKVRESDARLANAVEESLRYEPPVQFTVRTVKEAFDLDGNKLKKGQLVMLSLAGANRDPAINIDPDTFDVEREKVSHVSFGHGIHLCLGMSLARLEAGIALRQLFKRFEHLRLAQAKPAWGDSPLFRGQESMMVDSSPLVEWQQPEAGGT
jgi:cytochrome P450